MQPIACNVGQSNLELGGCDTMQKAADWILLLVHYPTYKKLHTKQAEQVMYMDSKYLLILSNARQPRPLPCVPLLVRVYTLM